MTDAATIAGAEDPEGSILVRGLVKIGNPPADCFKFQGRDGQEHTPLVDKVRLHCKEGSHGLRPEDWGLFEPVLKSRVYLSPPPEGPAPKWEAILKGRDKAPEAVPEPVRKARESAKKGPKARDRGDDTKESAARRLVELGCNDGDTEFFHDRNLTAYARVDVGGYHEVLPVIGPEFENWLTGLAYDAEGLAPGQTALDQAVKTLWVLASRGEERKVFMRHGTDGHSFYYDLCNGHGEAVRYDKDGWEVVHDPPVMFVRYPHMTAQVTPVRTYRPGALDKIIGKANLPSESVAILEVQIPSLCIPEISLMGAITLGPQGTGKSTTQIIASMVCDPSTDVRHSMPHKVEDLGLYLSQHRLATFDNVSHLREDESDILSRAGTGGTDTGRALYTNNGVNRRTYKAPTFMNGITITGIKADLFDRVLVYNTRDALAVDPIPENELAEAILDDLPEALGEMFDLLVTALGIYDPHAGGWRPRMADWYLWARAIAQAKGYSEDWMEGKLKPMLERRNYDAIAGDPVTIALEYVAKHGGFVGTAGELFELINDRDLDLPFNAGAVRSKSWPQSSDGLGRAISRIIGPLASHGVHIYRDTWSRLSRFKDEFEGLTWSRGGPRTFGPSERVVIVSGEALNVPRDAD